MTTSNELEDYGERHMLAEHVAGLVEDKLIAKAARWMLYNAAALIATLAAGIAAYFSLNTQLQNTRDRVTLQEDRMNAMVSYEAVARQSLSAQVEELNRKVDEINRFLRDHAMETRPRPN